VPDDRPTDELYELREDVEDLDMDRVFQWLSVESYWAAGRAREVVERSFAGAAATAAIYPADGGIGGIGPQVAVARLVSDGATFAWLCDVYVDAAHRGRGLGTRLAGWAADWAERHGVHRTMLATRDAHGVYAAVGFRPLSDPQRWMMLDRRASAG
jgi:GNAT superfamily N-acetyltransferase